MATEQEVMGAETTTALAPKSETRLTLLNTVKPWLAKAQSGVLAVAPSPTPGLVLGIVGAALWRRHPILGFISGMIIGSNATSILHKDKRSLAFRNISVGALGVGGAYVCASRPVLGFVAGSAIGGVLTSKVPQLPPWVEKVA